MTQPWVINKRVKYFRDPIWQRGPDTFIMCALWPLPWRYDLGSENTQPWVMDNNCVKYYPDPIWMRGIMTRTRIFWYVCILLDDMTLGHGQQLCKILPRSDNGAGS